MNIQVTDYVDVHAKAASLGCNIPSGVTILPHNFQAATTKDELLYETLDLDLRHALRSNGIHGTSLEESEDTSVQVTLRESFSAEWIPPIIFVSALALHNNPELLTILLNIGSDFFYDKLKTMFSREPTLSDHVEIDFIVQTAGDHPTYKRLRYKGIWSNNKLAGAKELHDIIRKM